MNSQEKKINYKYFDDEKKQLESRIESLTINNISISKELDIKESEINQLHNDLQTIERSNMNQINEITNKLNQEITLLKLNEQQKELNLINLSQKSNVYECVISEVINEFIVKFSDELSLSKLDINQIETNKYSKFLIDGFTSLKQNYSLISQQFEQEKKASVYLRNILDITEDALKSANIELNSLKKQIDILSQTEASRNENLTFLNVQLLSYQNKIQELEEFNKRLLSKHTFVSNELSDIETLESEYKSNEQKQTKTIEYLERELQAYKLEFDK
jgi:chromosome segregation ATPase